MSLRRLKKPTGSQVLHHRHHDMGLRTVYQSRYPKIDCHPLSSTNFVIVQVNAANRALLLKLFYQNDNSAIVALQKFRTLMGLRKCPLTATNLRLMVTKFEETKSLNVRSGRGKKPVSAEEIEKVALQVEEDKSSNMLASTSVRRVAEAFDLPRSTVQKIMRNILHYYPYKLQFVQELLPHYFETRHHFSLQFLARLEFDPERHWNILWTDKAHFHLGGSVNTHNCRFWETDNPHSNLRVPLHSPKVTVWCGFSASFILGPYFFEELGSGGPVTCSITGQRYASLLRK
ncbi:uncharacterized protein TNCV_2523521 [Trichonephila clavipes]|nr:uncharacterized protein TNCV_2523521 [Trichonephila clavipes]